MDFNLFSLKNQLNEQIDDMTADFIISQLLLLDSEDQKKDIRLFINSPGGSVTAGKSDFPTSWAEIPYWVGGTWVLGGTSDLFALEFRYWVALG